MCAREDGTRSCDDEGVEGATSCQVCDEAVDSAEACVGLGYCSGSERSLKEVVVDVGEVCDDIVNQVNDGRQFVKRESDGVATADGFLFQKQGFAST